MPRPHNLRMGRSAPVVSRNDRQRQRSEADFAEQPLSADPRMHVARLHHLLALFEVVAGMPPSPADRLTEATGISRAYERAPLIAQRRFDAFAAKTHAWALAGLDALIDASGGAHPPRAAAQQLARHLRLAIEMLARLIAP